MTMVVVVVVAVAVVAPTIFFWLVGSSSHFFQTFRGYSISACWIKIGLLENCIMHGGPHYFIQLVFSSLIICMWSILDLFWMVAYGTCFAIIFSQVGGHVTRSKGIMGRSRKSLHEPFGGKSTWSSKSVGPVWSELLLP